MIADTRTVELHANCIGEKERNRQARGSRSMWNAACKPPRQGRAPIRDMLHAHAHARAVDGAPLEFLADAVGPLRPQQLVTSISADRFMPRPHSSADGPRTPSSSVSVARNPTPVSAPRFIQPIQRDEQQIRQGFSPALIGQPPPAFRCHRRPRPASAASLPSLLEISGSGPYFEMSGSAAKLRPRALKKRGSSASNFVLTASRARAGNVWQHDVDWVAVPAEPKDGHVRHWRQHRLTTSAATTPRSPPAGLVAPVEQHAHQAPVFELGYASPRLDERIDALSRPRVVLESHHPGKPWGTLGITL